MRTCIAAALTAIVVGALPVAPSIARADGLDSIVQGCGLSANETVCKAMVKSFRDDWKKANRGDYQAQRNVAFCLSTGCNGAVGINPQHACAWRIVIMASDSAVDSGDAANLRYDCGDLSAPWQADAETLAKHLFRKIYHRKLDWQP